MIAAIGYPGESRHAWKRFADRKEAVAWLAAAADRLAERHPAAAASLLLSARLIPEKEAARIRYRDGRRCYPHDAETEYYAEQ